MIFTATINKAIQVPGNQIFTNRTPQLNQQQIQVVTAAQAQAVAQAAQQLAQQNAVTQRAKATVQDVADRMSTQRPVQLTVARANERRMR